jgi:hypothetical protein
VRRLVPALWLALAATAIAPLHAQSPAPAGPGAPAGPAAGVAGVVPASVTTPLWKRPWVRPLASLLVPGTGQLLARRDRGLVYLAADVWFVARALALGAQGRQQRSQFLTLAYDVARQPFAATRVDGPWEYYETMSHWVESGAYNLSTTGGFQPETDTLTFNGAMWLLARRNYFQNPDSIPPTTSAAYQAALAFYRQRAYGDAFRWSWRDARLEMDVYIQEIHNSDQGFRIATDYLGAIVANHLVSAVDALIMSRLTGSSASVMPRVHVTENPQRTWLIWQHAF